MEVKKSQKSDLQNKRRIFFLIGIAVALAAIIALFSWSQSTKVIDNIQVTGDVGESEIPAVTVETKSVEPIKVELTNVDILQIIKGDSKIIRPALTFDGILPGDLGKIKFKTSFTTQIETPVDEQTPVVIAEEYPSFQGKDLDAFRAWCGQNLVYPALAAENSVSGRVTLSFVVERDGSVSNVKVMRGVDKELDAAAIAVVSKSPKWSPGKNRGKPVRFTYTMPIDFILQ